MQTTPLTRTVFALLLTATTAFGAGGITYEPKPGPGAGKHVVFLSGDQEYRSEEALPMLAKILSQRHGFKCTVLFAEDPDGTINPNNTRSLAGHEALAHADALVTSLRYRAWPDEAMKSFSDAINRGLPIIAMRCSTHAFQFPAASTSPYKSWSDKGTDSFGEKVLGEEWITHWGANRRGLTKGLIEPTASDNSLLRGVGEIFGDSGVYEAHPSAGSTVLLRGQVLSGMSPTDPPSTARKRRGSDGQEQGMNDPMMPIAWTRTHINAAGTSNRIFTTTMGAASDLSNESLRRLVVNAVYWGLNLEVPATAEVRFVDPFEPTRYSMGGFRKGTKPDDHALGKVFPPVAAPVPAQPAATEEKK